MKTRLSAYALLAAAISLTSLCQSTLADDTNSESDGDNHAARRAGGELGLEIIDLHQASATRPMESLSGGESFLASLALALGLTATVALPGVAAPAPADDGLC